MPAAGETPRATTSVSKTATQSPKNLSNAETCQKLLGSDGGVISKAARFLTEVTELSDSTANEATELSESLYVILETARTNLQEPLYQMRIPLNDIADANEVGRPFTLDADRFKAAANEILAICDETATASATPLPAKTTEPSQAVPVKNISERHEIVCGSSTRFNGLTDFWASGEYKAGDSCKADYSPPSTGSGLLPDEQAVVDTIASKGGDVTVPVKAFERSLTLCAKLPYGWENTIAISPTVQMADAAGAIVMCPGAPHAAILQDVATVPRVDDGTHTVGTNMEPGIWQTKPGAKECYWARSTGNGDIIDNNFVGFAPDGVTVDVYQGEGFESSNCGVWRKIG